MKPYVGVVGPKTEADVVNCFSLFHEYGFLSDSSLHSPALFFDYGHDEIKTDNDLEALRHLMYFTADNLPTVELGLRYKHSKNDPPLSKELFTHVTSKLPPLSMFEFSHSYPAREFIHECMKDVIWTKFSSHVAVSSAISDLLSSYFKKRFYSHYVFDTKDPGFANPPGSAKKYFQSKKESVGFAAKLGESTGLHIDELVELTGKNISLEARCENDATIRRFLAESDRAFH